MTMNIKKLCIFAGVLLILAIPPGLPSDYYKILRIVIFIASVAVAWRFYKSHLIPWALIFGSVAFLFNVIRPIYLTRNNWVPIDFISAILFFLAAYSAKRE